MTPVTRPNGPGNGQLRHTTSGLPVPCTTGPSSYPHCPRHCPSPIFTSPSLQISDDEDDTHPNIDTPSLFRWRHQARVERMGEFEKKKSETKEGLEL